MEKIIHRVNNLKDLIKLPKTLGAEIDIRTDGSKLILNNEPIQKGDKFIDYIESADSKGTSTEKKGRKSKKEDAEVSN